MKIKISALLIFLLCICLSGCQSPGHVLYFGTLLKSDNVTLIDKLEESYTVDINQSFAAHKMHSSLLYSYLEKDAENIVDKKKISSLIKSSSKIFINIGLYDLLPLIKVEEGIITFEQNIIDEQIELFEFYLYLSIDLICNLNSSVDLYILGAYNPLILEKNSERQVSLFITQINLIMKSIAEEFMVHYVDLFDVNKYLVIDNQLSDQGIDYIVDQIKETDDG